MARPCSYTPEVGQRICERLAGGETLIAICKDESLPGESTVRAWVVKQVDDDDPLKAFQASYARARETQAMRWADEIVEISDDAARDTYLAGEDEIERVNHEVLARSKLRVDTRKFLMGKVLPRVFGDSIAVTGAGGGPIETKEMGGRDLARRVALLLAGGLEGEGK